jgi:hypothetical protein
MTTPIIAFLRAGGSSFWEQLAGWYQNSTLGELVAYFKDTYFTIHFGAYDNFSITEQTASLVNKIIPALVWGLIIAAVATIFSRRAVGGFVDTLIKKEAFSPDASVTLFDTGKFRSTVVRRELCRSAFLRKVVLCREEQAFYAQKGKDATYKIDFTKDHFYIPEDLKYRAENRFSQKGSGWLFVVLSVILVPFVVGLLCRLMPGILNFADSLITLLAP